MNCCYLAVALHRKSEEYLPQLPLHGTTQVQAGLSVAETLPGGYIGAPPSKLRIAVSLHGAAQTHLPKYPSS